MSKYVGCIGDRITATVELVSEYHYERRFGFASQTNYIYTMADADGNVYVWKTTSCLLLWDDTTECNDVIRKGDTMTITGTVKEHSEYKGVKQTILTRCKFSLVAHKPDETIVKRERQEQTLNDGDKIVVMAYRQYKEHYSDCETVYGSFDEEQRTVKVIVRAGRMKPSGVRGKHFHGYVFQREDGKRVGTYRAVSEENARKQLEKDFPDSQNWECCTVYR